MPNSELVLLPVNTFNNTDRTKTEKQTNIYRKTTNNRQKNTHKTDRSFSRLSYDMIIILSITVYVRLEIILFFYDTMNGTFNKWDDTISEITLGWLNPEAQSGLVLLHVNMRNKTDRTRTEHKKNTDKGTSKHRHKIDEELIQNRANVGSKSTENRQKFLEVEFRNDYSIQITVHIRLQITIFTYDARNGTIQ